jgi:hypothetical protein
MGYLFTPYMKGDKTGKRATMSLNEIDIKKIKRGRRWSATVVDQNTGRKYKVRGASCGLPHCFCAAIAEETTK